ncbi:MAG: hypothetical protein HY554_11075, partial [Elusimicrobia bacterium]|nr:hypothetical protein [Elusimicrobiota bacterium]
MKGVAKAAACAWLLAARPGLAFDHATIVANGPVSEKLDIVFLGDGYTAAELPKYRRDVQDFAAYLLATPPFSDYKTFFNVHRVDVVSRHSGTDNRCTSVAVDTALDTGFFSTGPDCRLLYSSSPEKVNDAADFAPAADTIIIIVNTETYGGSGGTFGVFYRGAAGREVMAHEVGHSLARLADEYDYGRSATFSGSEPASRNVTTNTDRASLKWRDWVSPSTPLPTRSSKADVPGLYEGAVYSRFKVYRPTYRSKMRELGVPFETVNYALLVDRFMDFIPPDATPAAAAVTVDGGCGRAVGRSIAVRLTGADPESQVLAFRLSGSPSFEDAAWRLASNAPAFSMSLPWTFSGGDGPRTLYAQIKNGYGLVSAAACPVTLDTTAPLVSITAPAPGSSVSGSVRVSAGAADAAGVARVQFRLDGADLGSADLSAPFAIDWDAARAAPGTHALTAAAWDAAGNRSISAEVRVTVKAPSAATSLSAEAVETVAEETFHARATLRDAAGAALSGKIVIFGYRGSSKTALTDALGTATTAYGAGPSTGSFGCSAAFAGEAEAAASGATATVTVRGRPTSLEAAPLAAEAGGTFHASATLRDVLSGASLPGKAISLSYLGEVRTAATDATGSAATAYDAGRSTGPQILSLAFDGDTVYSASRATLTIMV